MANRILTDLFDNYNLWKTSTKAKDRSKDAFFEWANEMVSSRSLATANEKVKALSEGEATRKATEQFPRWDVEAVAHIEEDYYNVVLREKAAFQDFSFVDKDQEVVFTRKIVQGSPTLDDEELKKNDPDLYEEVTQIPTERELKSLEDLSSEQLAKLSEYMHEGKPTTKLLAPRKAKPEELAEAE